MTVVPLLQRDDLAWFRSNPDRAYRLRRAVPPEMRAWPEETRRGLHFWTIVRAADGERIPFATRDGGLPIDNVDAALGEVFAEVEKKKAARGQRSATS